MTACLPAVLLLSIGRRCRLSASIDVPEGFNYLTTFANSRARHMPLLLESSLFPSCRPPSESLEPLSPMLLTTLVSSR